MSDAAPAPLPLISGNWKMHLNHFEAIQMVQKLAFALSKDTYERAEVSVHPPFTDLRTVQTVLESDHIPIRLGAQHCHFDDSGAFTGEVSPAMLTKLNVTYVLAGHSERRHLFGDTDEMVQRRVSGIRRNGMTPIVCVGETSEQRAQSQTDSVITSQVLAALAGMEGPEIAQVVVAYEPVWAIGTGNVASADDAQQAAKTLRAAIAERFGAEAATLRVQYGGSVKAVNAHELLAQGDIDGLLVGGASLEPEEFARIIQAV